MQIEVKGRNTPVTDDIRELVERASPRSPSRSPTWPSWRWSSTRSATRPTRSLRGRGDAVPQGRDAAGQDSSRDMAPLPQPLRGRARPPGQAPPRQASQAPGGAAAAAQPPETPERRRRARSRPRCRPRSRVPRGGGRPAPAPGAGVPPTTLRTHVLLDRALRIGEGKQFRQFEKRVARIADFEPELELESDDELRARIDVLREHVRSRPTTTRPRRPRRDAARGLRRRPRGRPAHPGRCATSTCSSSAAWSSTTARSPRCAPARARPSPPRCRRPERPGRPGRPPRHGQRLPRPPRRRVDDADLRVPRRHRRDSAERAWTTRTSARGLRRDVTYGTNSEFGFDYLRDNMAQRIEEQVQHGGRIATTPPSPRTLRDRRRGRQHPHRRGAHAADHLRRARAGRRPLRQVRQARRRSWSPARSPRAWTRGRARTSSPTSTTSSTRSTRPSRSPSRASRRPRSFLGIDHLYRAENGPLVNHLIQSLKAESLYKRDVDYAVDRRRGEDHRRVHRPHPGGPPLVGGPAPGGRGQGGRARSRRRTRPSRRSPTRTSSASTRSSPA